MHRQKGGWHGMGAVLMQESHPIAYLSKAFNPKNLGLSVYEKELMAMVMAVANSKYAYDTRLLKYKGKLYVGKGGSLRKKIVQSLHNSPLGGHSGQARCLQRVKATIYWPLMKFEVVELARTCDVCQRNKHENIPYPELLQPLSIPSQAWSQISMDIIEKLPLSYGYDTVMVVVDSLTKLAHFIPLAHLFSIAMKRS
ncbi:hypothetical protein ACH5RR_029070 [Cinchona calisaya]|uniref:Integrase zinc-binding domain-containing protein n=1 Tax=Cinchona calisaya TaxID=153742 RepID=A0ABD2YQL4_9GENT